MRDKEQIMDDFEYKICVEYNDCSECPFGKPTGEYFTCGIGTKEQFMREVRNDRLSKDDNFKHQVRKLFEEG